MVQIPSYWNTIDAMPDTAFPNKFLTRVAVDHSRADMNLGPAATAQVDSVAVRTRAGESLRVLLTGGSRTGKTMLAEVLAAETRRLLYRVELSGVVSKYIGETEKNLDRVFNAATDARAILLFDEADALFGRRSAVRDDRYANLDTGNLLERMEAFMGLAVLTTNLRNDLDNAFLKRLHVVIDVPPPVRRKRLTFWRRVLAWLRTGPTAP